MSPAEIKFLKRLVYASKINPPDPEAQGFSRDGWIEVGAFAGIHMNTVKAFEKAGLIELEARGSNNSQTWARLIVSDLCSLAQEDTFVL